MKSSFARAIGTAARAVAAAARAVLAAVVIAGCLLFIAAVGAIAVVLSTGAPVLVPGVINLWRDASAGDPAIMFVPQPAGILVSILAVAAVVWIARRPPQGVRRRPVRPRRSPVSR